METDKLSIHIPPNPGDVPANRIVVVTESATKLHDIASQGTTALGSDGGVREKLAVVPVLPVTDSCKVFVQVASLIALGYEWPGSMENATQYVDPGTVATTCSIEPGPVPLKSIMSVAGIAASPVERTRSTLPDETRQPVRACDPASNVAPNHPSWF